MPDQTNALFVDLRRVQPAALDAYAFDLAYIVTADLEHTQSFFKKHHRILSAIPHITCEITQPDTLHLVTRLPSVTRLSVPHAMLVPQLADHFALDITLHWDHRRKTETQQSIIRDAIGQGAQHLSLYGLQDFTVWQTLQTMLHKQDFTFYDRFHACCPGRISPYQQHLASFGNIVAHGGWSRVTENGVTRTKGPRAIRWTTLSPAQQHEERLLIGLSARSGMPLQEFSDTAVTQSIQSGLASRTDTRLCPTDQGLWHQAELVALLLAADKN